MKVCEFLKEHIHLINLLSKSRNKKMLRESEKQTKEVLNYLQKLNKK